MSLLPGGLLPGGLLPFVTRAAGPLPNVDLPTFVMVDPRVNAARVDPCVTVHALDPAITAVKVDG